MSLKTALALCAACLSLSPLPGVASEPASIVFTAAEQAYLDRVRSVKMCVDPDWEPFERINEQGRHEGIGADLVQLVAQRSACASSCCRCGPGTKAWPPPRPGAASS